MEMQTVKVDANDLKKLILDVGLMKEILLSERLHHDSERELTDWAKKELAETRATPDSELISSEEIERMIFEG